MSKSRMDDGSHQSSGLLSPDETACPWKEGGWMPGDQPAGEINRRLQNQRRIVTGGGVQNN